jgi:hypothetical protein
MHNRIEIENRPKIADLKVEIAHGGGDTLMGGHHAGVLVLFGSSLNFFNRQLDKKQDPEQRISLLSEMVYFFVSKRVSGGFGDRSNPKSGGITSLLFNLLNLFALDG